MTARMGSYVVLLFAAVWLWIGASALPMPWAAAVGTVGILVLLAGGWSVLQRPVAVGGGRRFDRRKFAVAVVFEIVAANIVAFVLGKYGLIGYIWPALGVVVALHFIGLWWASGDRRFITLTIGMLAVNVVAMAFGPNGAAILAIAGLGSSVALALAMVWR